ncbi:MAG: hypothetical protein ACKO2P_20495 [Planctomycetota bacterium]
MDSSGHQVDCPLTYLTLRAAFLCALDSLMHNCLSPPDRDEADADFFRFYPPLAGMAPQIQMECVLRTWRRWNSEGDTFPNPLDARVLYAATELLAHLAADSSHPMLRVLFDGPRRIGHLNDHWLPARARCLQITRESRFSQGIQEELSLSESAGEQFLNPDSAPFHGEIMEILGKWRASGCMADWGSGLLTPAEQELVRDFFEEHPGLTE